MRGVVSVLAAAVFLAVVFAPAASAAPTAYIEFHNAESGKCLSAEGGRMANGTKVIQYTCNDASDQGWIEQGGQLKNRKDPSFCLSAPNNWTSLAVSGSSHAERAPVVQWTWSHMRAKIWFAEYVIDG